MTIRAHLDYGWRIRDTSEGRDDAQANPTVDIGGKFIGDNIYVEDVVEASLAPGAALFARPGLERDDQLARALLQRNLEYEGTR